MDDVLEENLENHALPEQKQAAKDYRNIGIGVMGLHDTLIKMGYVYGSKESVVLVSSIMCLLLSSTLGASEKLAVERGSFPKYSDKVWEATILKKLCNGTIVIPENTKLRNCSLLSIAPTGSIGTMWNVSTGVEPWYALKYIRNTKSLEGKDSSFEVWAPVAQEAKEKNWHPETLVTSNDISWKHHIDIQAACQKYCDTSISKTINMPKGTTSKQIREVYMYAWKQGLKGCTVYVDGSRDPILTTDNNPTESKHKHLDSIEPISRDEFGEALIGYTYKHRTACGTLYITINKDNEGNIVEIFTNSSKNGTCKANLNGETRMASLALRAGVKVEEVIDQLKGIHCQSCAFARAKGNQIDGTSCPDIIAKCIKKAYSPYEEITHKEVCPECGKPVRHEGGCITCECGYSKCG